MNEIREDNIVLLPEPTHYFLEVDIQDFFEPLETPVSLNSITL